MITGTAISITTVFSDSVSSATITIYDPADSAKVSDAAMSSQGSNTYLYIFQSLTTYTPGVYKVLISGVSGSYTSMARDNFTLERE